MKEIIIKTLLILIFSTLVIPLLYGTLNYEVNAAFDTEPYVRGIKNDETTGTTKLDGIGSTIIGLLRGFGTIASVATLIVIGIRYMTVSVEEKAQYKKNMVPYIIGAVMVFSIVNLLAIVVDIVKAI